MSFIHLHLHTHSNFSFKDSTLTVAAVADSARRLGMPAVALGENVCQMSEREAALKSVEAVNKLKDDIGIPVSLRAVNISVESVESLAKDAATFRLLPNSPRRLTIEDLRIIISRAIG
ncbi:MAG: iron-containing alcohol dehydrogenase [Negativicutes bacterium]|nr:iron-containing alcohol dehydrogenase [Negativicutes bacterium]